ncbi:hypothetical protein SteCoe_25373 [Stentor coeruleus]|uniref:Peptidase A1 domain-containing protein n=1 Tax=Stentor coeruleus TaxID=5963 RepID=A0A1R2BFD6_9CILI|nr:hypothetical protein SteCoe_25373 [Stentor coeruleus]
MTVILIYIGFATLLNFASSSKLKTQTQKGLHKSIELKNVESINLLDTKDVSENEIPQHLEVALSIGTPAVNVIALINQASVGIAVLIADSKHPSYYNYSASSTLTDFQSDSKFWDFPNVNSGNEKIVFNKYTLESQEVYFLNSSIIDNYDYSIIGLGYDTTLNEKHLLTNLKKSGYISEANYAINYKCNSIDVGVNIEEYNSMSNVIVLNSNDSWIITPDSVDISRFSYTQQNAQFRIEKDCISGPSSQINDLFNEIINITSRCTEYNDHIKCSCTENQFELLPKITFKFDNKKLEIEGKHYTVYKDGQCEIFVSNKTYTDNWVLGKPFYNGHTAVFDIETKKISINPISKCEKLIQITNLYEIIFGIFAIVTIASFVVMLVIILVKSKNEKGYKRI